MEFNLMKRAAVWCLCFSAVAVGIIIYLSFQKSSLAGEATPFQADTEEEGNFAEASGNEEDPELAHADTQGSGPGKPSEGQEGQRQDGQSREGQAGEDGKESEEGLFLSEGAESEFEKLTFFQGESDTSYLRIPLPKGCRAKDIAIENYYMDQELWILIDGVDGSFYAENTISGNQEMVRQGIYEEDEDGLRLRFKLTGIFEYRTILENNELYISFLNPREVYDKIVVIDPACGGFDTGYTWGELKEKEINLAIAAKLKEKLDQTDIKVYYTRMDDVNPAKESRIRLANETRADMYIRIELSVSQDSGDYGTTAVYNGRYFIPGFGNVELADFLEKEVVSSIRGKALGLEETDSSEELLKYITVPAAIIRAGCATNKQEATLLEREDYQEKIATGIYNAILKAYKEYK